MSIDISFTMPWRIRTPVIYRYMQKAYVDEFMTTGALRLSSYSNFRSHESAAQGDRLEGKVVATVLGPDSMVVSAINYGNNAVVLCTSTTLSRELMNEFGADSVLRINDSTNFAIAVAKRTPEYLTGVEGFCNYANQDYHQVTRKALHDAPAMAPGVAPGVYQGTPPAEFNSYMSNVIGVEPYFVKRKKYSYQNEYRFVWVLGRDVNHHVDIFAPEARGFCEVIDINEFENDKLLD